MKAEQNYKNFSKDDEKLIKEWKRNRQLTTNSIHKYKSYIKHYTTATQMTLTQLYNEAITEEEQGTPKHKRQIREHILDFHDYLDETNLSESTKNGIIHIVNSFYKAHEITVPPIPNNYDDTPLPQNTQKMINKDIINMMLDNAGIRNKAIISLIATTGQSPQELSNLTVQDVIDC